MTLSVVMITENAGDVIEETLKSIEGVWDELLVSDGGSIDETVPIVKQYGGKIFLLQGKNLGERKQWLMRKAKGNWVLILDSDERVSDVLHDEIRQIVKNPQKSRGIAGYKIPYQNYVFGKSVYYGGEKYSKVRLFRKNKGTIDLFPIHEEIHVKGKVGVLRGVLHHYSYRSFAQLFGKFNTYARVLAEQKFERQERVNLHKLFSYGPHMFWSRFVKEQGYKDGWRGFVLAGAFGYMEAAMYWMLFVRGLM